MIFRSNPSSHGGSNPTGARRNQKGRQYINAPRTQTVWLLIAAVLVVCALLVVRQVAKGRTSSEVATPSPGKWTNEEQSKSPVRHENVAIEHRGQNDAVEVPNALVTSDAAEAKRGSDAQKVLDAIAVDLASDRLMLGDMSHGAPVAAAALRLRWNPLAFQRSSELFSLRIATVLRKQRRDSAHLLSEELNSLHRYRLGGIALLLGRSDSQFSQQIPYRCKACESIEQINITKMMIEVPRSPSDGAFVAFTARRKLERVHHCFSQQSMFLLATFAAESSVFEQIEMIMGLLYLGAVSSRTVVIPSIRLSSGRRVPLSHLFDVRLLYTSAATGYAQQPVVCILEEDEFVTLEASRLDLLQRKESNSAVGDDKAAAALYARLKDTSCLQATWLREVKKQSDTHVTAEDHINCEEVLNVHFPTLLTHPIQSDSSSSTAAGFDAGSTIETERALDEAVLELAGSFHRVVHIGPLMTSALSVLIPAALRGLEAFAARADEEDHHHAATEHSPFSSRTGAPPAARLHRCLWRLLLPHPFTRRGVKLFDLVTEELVPSPSGRKLTLSERNVDSDAPLIASAMMSPPPTNLLGDSVGHADQTLRSTFVSSWRQGGISIHHHPVFPGGVTCVGLDKFYTSRGGGPLCRLSNDALRVIVDGLRSGAAVGLHYGARSEAEVFVLMRQIEYAILEGQHTTPTPADDDEAGGAAPARRNPLDVRHVLKSPNLFHRTNRLTRFIQAVEDRRKLFIGKGNLLLQGGFSDMTSADCPFALHNPFAAEPGLLAELIEFWSMIFDDGFVSTSPWSAMTRTVLMRRRANLD
ncbi:membrane-associated protein, putative [Bodo saltans]|uniref:Membrane-associated protein, putative n=1 Tax=Bodo saltans TaxID=75058 RepID=A0A0S4IYR3_BODSA|nr:membrane-associated protein, putative [Bodo saltans]|eukprot:CUG00100.1 membrane-associated protein, putative [Bodo saltans]